VPPLQLTFASYIYLDRTRALSTGQVTPAGIDLNHQVVDIGELFRRMAQHASFDVAEMSTSTYMLMRGQGDERLVGLPVFLSRAFRHNMVYVNADAGIERPEDLKGKNVGVPEYQMTAALWIRAFLEHDYGVKPSDIRWWYGGIEQPGYTERREHDPPPGVHLEPIPQDKALVPMLEAGELDAYVTAGMPRAFRERSPKIRRLFPNWRAVERDYFVRTGFFPIMHMTVVRRDVYERHPWVVESLMDAFVDAKRRGLDRLRNLGALAVTLPWIAADFEEIDELFGGDPFPYGFEQNRAILEAMTQYSYEQGLTPRKLDPAELFAPEAVEHPGDAVAAGRRLELV
jgi:4,5-dihydroxyphthalate decarboxylase